jgi:hypothetical protein
MRARREALVPARLTFSAACAGDDFSAAILCEGLGSRLGELTATTSKLLLRVDGVPFPRRPVVRTAAPWREASALARRVCRARDHRLRVLRSPKLIKPEPIV